MLSCIPFYSVQVYYADWNDKIKCILALFPNTGLGFVIKSIVRFEETATGLQWSRFADKFTIYDGYSVSAFLQIMMFGATLFFYCAYRIGRTTAVNSDTTSTQDKKLDTNTDQSPLFFEQEPIATCIGVRTTKLSRQFGKQKLAVDEVTLNLHVGHVTLLLGRNGAGTYHFFIHRFFLQLAHFFKNV